MRDHIAFAIWVLAKLDEYELIKIYFIELITDIFLSRGAIFVFTDETWLEIGDVHCQKRVSQPKGANAYNYACPKRRTTLCIIFWRSMAEGYKGH